MTTATLDRTSAGLADAAHAVVERLDHLDLTSVPGEGLKKAKGSAAQLAAKTSKAGQRAKDAVPDVGQVVKTAAVKTGSASSRRIVIGVAFAIVALLGWQVLRRRTSGTRRDAETSGASQYARTNGSAAHRSGQSALVKDPSGG